MQLQLKNIGLGAIQEKFELVLMDVVENILDPNTTADKVREINVRFKIKPSVEDRACCKMESSVTCKMTPTRSLDSILHVGIDENGVIDAAESVPQQGELFPTPDRKAKVVTINE